MSVRPVYLVVDESASMGPELDDVSRAILDLADLVRRSPAAADRLPVAVYGFSDDVIRYRRLAPLGAGESLPVLTARGGTAYGPVLRALRTDIDADVAQLKAAGAAVQRPLLLFFTDGEPIDTGWVEGPWWDAGWSARPAMVVGGHGDVDRRTLQRLAGDNGAVVLPAEGWALGSFAADVIRSVTNSLVAAPEGLGGPDGPGVGGRSRSRPIQFPLSCVRYQ